MATALDFYRKYMYFMLPHGKTKPCLELKVHNGDILNTGSSVIADLTSTVNKTLFRTQS